MVFVTRGDTTDPRRAAAQPPRRAAIGQSQIAGQFFDPTTGQPETEEEQKRRLAGLPPLTKPISPTPLEILRQQDLPIGQRELTEEEFETRQSRVILRGTGVVEEAKRPEGLPGVSFDIREKVSELETRGIRGDITIPERAIGLGLGVALPFIEFPERAIGLVGGLFTQPKETLIALPGGFQQELVGVAGQIKSPTPEVGIGRIVGEVAVFKGIGRIPKGITKVSDIVRTTGKAEVPVGKIVAPEFPKQTFPRIRPGETAGELLAEFKPIRELGEVRPAGFHAAERPLAGEIIAPLGRPSELPGLFISPKVSPRFLRLAGEQQKLIGLNPFETFRPTAIRITPEKFELVPGLRAGERAIQPGKLIDIREFFKTAPREKAFIPFLKTEKEAVIPAGALFKKKKPETFFRFEGRRIPIQELELVKPLKPPKPGVDKGLVTTPEILKSISRGRPRQPPIIDPSSLARLSRGVSRGRPISRARIPPSLPSIISLPPRRRVAARPSRAGIGLPSRAMFRPSTRISFIPSRPIARPFGSVPRPPPPAAVLPRFGVDVFQKGLKAKRLFKETPSLFDVAKFQLGFKVPKREKVFGETGLVGFGVGAKLPKIQLGSLISDIKITNTRTTRRKNVGTKRKKTR